jgi:hypothetical protein
MITPAELQKVLPLSSVKEGASAETPLDREIASLLQDGKIREELKEFAHLHARTAVHSGVRQAEQPARPFGIALEPAKETGRQITHGRHPPRSARPSGRGTVVG